MAFFHLQSSFFFFFLFCFVISIVLNLLQSGNESSKIAKNKYIYIALDHFLFKKHIEI